MKRKGHSKRRKLKAEEPENKEKERRQKKEGGRIETGREDLNQQT